MAAGALFGGLGEEGQAVGALALILAAAARLHAGRAIEEDEHGLGRAARGRTEPAADERSGHGPDEEEQDEAAEEEQEVLPILARRVAARFALSRKIIAAQCTVL